MLSNAISQVTVMTLSTAWVVAVGVSVVVVGVAVLGGIFYTLGAAVFAYQKPDPWPHIFGFHEVFYFVTVLGVSRHYCAIGFRVERMAVS